MPPPLYLKWMLRRSTKRSVMTFSAREVPANRYPSHKSEIIHWLSAQGIRRLTSAPARPFLTGSRGAADLQPS